MQIFQRKKCDGREIAFCKRLIDREVSWVLLLQGTKKGRKAYRERGWRGAYICSRFGFVQNDPKWSKKLFKPLIFNTL